MEVQALDRMVGGGTAHDRMAVSGVTATRKDGDNKTIEFVEQFHSRR